MYLSIFRSIKIESIECMLIQSQKWLKKKKIWKHDIYWEPMCLEIHESINFMHIQVFEIVGCTVQGLRIIWETLPPIWIIWSAEKIELHLWNMEEELDWFEKLILWIEK